ncbi:membrane protein [Streptomyces albiaxialis]|uniref:Membrane protein n=1 Tax=Streptomyces albiaxialis TaxID=329523 RepID=A0ABP5HJA2_9ACTN
MSTDLSPEPEERPGPQRRRRQLSVVSVAAAVLLAGGGGAYWASVASDGGGDDTSAGDAPTPPRLTLDGNTLGTQEAARSDKGGPGIAPGEPMGPRALKAAADLPDGPDSAAVHRTDRRATEAQVKELAKALKLDGTPEKKKDHWEVKASGEEKPGAPMLGVNLRDEGPEWAYMSQGAATGRCATPAPGQEHLRGGQKPGGAPQCLPGPGAGEGDPVSESKAKDAVRPVLKTLGLEDAALDTRTTGGAVRMVTAEPRVEGKATHGWESTFLVGKDGRIMHAMGDWGDSDKGAEYPVMSASQTLNELNKARQKGGGVSVQCAAPDMGNPERPQPAVALEQHDFVPGPPCGSGSPAGPAGPGKKKGPEKVVGAEFGYAMQASKGKPVLVPSWIYDVRRPDGKGTYPVAYPAVEPKFLKPSDSVSAPGEKPAPGGSGAPSPSTPGSGTEKPGGGGIGTGGGSGGGSQAVNSYEADGKKLKLTFWGGVCDTYEAKADESGSKVKITLTSKPKDPEKKVCVKIAKRMTTEVTLDKALGDRKVVDARDGDVVPRR